MKKFVVFFISIILIFSLSERQVFSYEFGSFYSDIANNITEYDNLIFSVDLERKDGIAKELNKKIGKNCFKDSLTAKDFDILVKTGSPSVMKNHLNKECLGENGIMLQTMNEKIQSSISAFNKELKEETRSKTDTIVTLSGSSVYSDGSLQNSPFDLMHDIQEIDEIVFERSEEITYESGKDIDLGKKIKDKLKEKAIDNATKKLQDKITKKLNICKLGGSCDENKYIDALIEEEKVKANNPKIFTDLSSTQVCPVNTSGLQNITEKIVKNSIESKKNNVPAVTLGDDGYSIKNNKNEDITISSDYKGTNDNSLFPCNDFFCVKVKFNIYNHNLLGGWVREHPSIEFLLKRANNHLKPIVAGSLVQSKMTLNNFELSLKDINLSEQFHMGLQVSSKPVPILDLQKDFSSGSDKEGTTEEPIYSVKNQLQEFYKTEGLDYESPNDLSLVFDYSADKIATDHARGLSPEKAIKDLEDYRSNLLKNSKKVAIIKDEIYKKVQNEGINYLDNQYKEVEVMNKAVKDYISSLDAILTSFLEKPVDKGQN